MKSKQDVTAGKALALGTKTLWGKIQAVGMLRGERYYWCIKNGVVSMMPADVVEEAIR